MKIDEVRVGDLIDGVPVIRIEGPFFDQIAHKLPTNKATKKRPISKTEYCRLCENEVEQQYNFVPGTIRLVLANCRTISRRVEDEIEVLRIGLAA